MAFLATFENCNPIVESVKIEKKNHVQVSKMSPLQNNVLITGKAVKNNGIPFLIGISQVKAEMDHNGKQNESGQYGNNDSLVKSPGLPDESGKTPRKGMIGTSTTYTLPPKDPFHLMSVNNSQSQRWEHAQPLGSDIIRTKSLLSPLTPSKISSNYNSMLGQTKSPVALHEKMHSVQITSPKPANKPLFSPRVKSTNVQDSPQAKRGELKSPMSTTFTRNRVLASNSPLVNHIRHSEESDEKDSLAEHNIADLLAKTNYSRHELYIIYGRYKALCHMSGGDGIDKNTFKTGISRLAIEDDMFVDRVFDLVDQDGSGQIEWDEFLTALSALEKGSNDLKAKFCLQIYDLDGDGLVSRSDLSQMFLSSCMLENDNTTQDVCKAFVDRVFSMILPNTFTDQNTKIALEDIIKYMKDHSHNDEDVWDLFGRSMLKDFSQRRGE